MNYTYNNISIILVSHKSRDKIINIIKKISKKINIIIVDNSNDTKFKKSIKKFKNTKVYLVKNKGFSAALNFGAKKILTKYFLVFSPDIKDIKDKSINCFLKKPMKKFGVIGVRFNEKFKYKEYYSKVKKVNGSVMFFEKKTFDKLKGFDENYFLFWEETDYCKRANLIGLNNYILNEVKVKHTNGVKYGSVKISNKLEKKKLVNLYSWHFLWSKFYYYKKHYGFVYATIHFVPIILRTIYRISLYKAINENDKVKRYTERLNGIINSLLLNKSSKRI